MNKYEKIAEWIVYECDSPQEEVAWLLEKLYENEKPKLTFKEAYEDIEWEEKESEVA